MVLPFTDVCFDRFQNPPSPLSFPKPCPMVGAWCCCQTRKKQQHRLVLPPHSCTLFPPLSNCPTRYSWESSNVLCQNWEPLLLEGNLAWQGRVDGRDSKKLPES
uniref:Uncharacterized protein n=1 Tax=Sphaerodactylus townsendi TaxID=933632 RepID=A0ACB8EMR4_9SAUR